MRIFFRARGLQRTSDASFVSISCVFIGEEAFLISLRCGVDSLVEYTCLPSNCADIVITSLLRLLLASLLASLLTSLLASLLTSLLLELLAYLFYFIQLDILYLLF